MKWKGICWPFNSCKQNKRTIKTVVIDKIDLSNDIMSWRLPALINLTAHNQQQKQNRLRVRERERERERKTSKFQQISGFLYGNATNVNLQFIKNIAKFRSSKFSEKMCTCDWKANTKMTLKCVDWNMAIKQQIWKPIPFVFRSNETNIDQIWTSIEVINWFD